MHKILPLVMLLIAGCQAPILDNGQTVGMTAPDFKVRRPGDKTADVKLSDFKGKIVLLDFWATWCGPCRMAKPDVEALYSKYKDKGFEVMAISTEDPEVLVKYEKEEKPSYPIYVDLFDEATAPFNIGSYPTFILIGRNGRVIGDMRGYGQGMLEPMVAKAFE